jgi:hypothetical protein
MGNMLRQYQLRVTPANDLYESEADEMSQRAASMPETQIREQATELAEKVTPLVQRQQTPVEEEEVQAKQIQQEEINDEDEEVQAKHIQRQEADEEQENLQTSSAQTDKGGTISPQMEERMLQLMQGGGSPLDKETREYFESRFGADFSQVRVHDDTQAAQIAARINARAFTQGQHIFFGQGQYQPQTSSGRDLLAHELTHTIQQGATSASRRPYQQKRIQRSVLQRANGGDGGGPGNDPYRYSDTEIFLGPLHLTPFKMAGHRGLLYTSRRLFRERNFTRGNPGQRDVWFGSEGVETSNVESKLLGAPFNMQPDRHYMFKPRSGVPESELRFGTPGEIAPNLKFPYWDNQGNSMKGRDKFQVDHIVELQIGGWPTNKWLNTIENLELLDPSSNQSSGASINAWFQGVGRGKGEVDRFIESGTGQSFREERLPERLRDSSTSIVKDHVLSQYKIVFEGTPITDRNEPGNVRFWRPDQIDNGEHIDAFMLAGKAQRPLNLHDLGDPDRNDNIFSPFSAEDQIRLFGSSERIVIYYQSFGGKNGFMQWRNRPFGEPVTSFQRRDHNSMGIELESMTINNQGEGGNELGHFTGKPFAWRGRGDRRMSESSINATVLRLPGKDFAGYISPQSMDQITASLSMLSPITINSISFEDEAGLTARGKLLTTIPLFQRADIDIVLNAEEVRLEKAFDVGEINVPPPFSIPSSSFILSLGSESGLGVRGQIDFAIDRVGQGYIGASAQTGRRRGSNGGLSLEGSFDFDTELFNPARIELLYRDNQFGARGTIGIPSGRINGIRSAEFTIGYENNRITASGTAQFTAPGIQNAGLNLTYSEEEGLTIGGTLQLGEVPGLRSGSLEAEIQRNPDGGYKVSASGTAQPAIPGINSQVRLSYDDGIFDANVTASYSRGMLSGDLTIGATNRPVDPENNEPAGDPEPTNVRTYGGGQVTVQLTPWLQGTVGIKLLPNAEIELRGEIALPNAVDLFPRRSVEKNIFTLDIDIPIVGVTVLRQRIGIFATIGGGVDVSAGFGPGQLRELSLGITYNPDHEDQTHVVGRGQLHVPADAGVRLFVRGGLGAGIPVVSATARLEVSGELGLQGALEANVNVDWMPSTGLEINARTGIIVEPRLRLSVDAYVDVSADLLLKTIELYHKRWNLAGVEYGSNLQFGINFPIHYKEGEPFDVSLDDIEFTVPDIDARRMIKGVLDQF